MIINKYDFLSHFYITYKRNTKREFFSGKGVPFPRIQKIESGKGLIDL